MTRSKIEWTEEVWNPVTGCDPVSSGCDNCYARRMATRLKGRFGYPLKNPFTVNMHPDRLEQPLKWKKPRRVFVCSMGDLFHREVGIEFQWQVFSIIERCPQHTFIILTKRPERMQVFIHDWLQLELKTPTAFPMTNVHLYVSVENQRTANERIPALLDTPAVVRGISIEPMLGSVNLFGDGSDEGDWTNNGRDCKRPHICHVIVGGESGPGARPINPAWVQLIRDQCKDAGIPFFFKQWGHYMPGTGKGWRLREDCAGEVLDWDTIVRGGEKTENKKTWVAYDFAGKPCVMKLVGKKAAGRILNGRTWDELPEVKS